MKRVLRTLLLSILIVMTLGTVAQAKEIYKYKAITTKQNTWYKVKSNELISNNYNGSEWVYTYTSYRYKVTVPANYYLTLTVRNNGYNPLGLYKALKADYYEYYYADSSVKTYKIALPKGTYYFGQGYNDKNLAFKYKLYKYVNKPNYKSSKALNWNANKKLAIVQLPGHSYPRWYKIKLTKKKRVYIWGADHAVMLDAKHKSVRVESNNYADGYTYGSYEKLKPGIYYIGIIPDYSRNGSVEIVWWK